MEEERMASSKEYLAYISEQISRLEDIRYRAMMGEYILYYREKVVGGIYDDRFLIKNDTTAREWCLTLHWNAHMKGKKKCF